MLNGEKNVEASSGLPGAEAVLKGLPSQLESLLWKPQGETWDCNRTQRRTRREGEGNPVVNLPPKSHFSCAQTPAFPRSSQIFLDYRNTNNILKPDGKSLGRGRYSRPERLSKRRSSSWNKSLLCGSELLSAQSLPPPDPTRPLPGKSLIEAAVPCTCLEKCNEVSFPEWQDMEHSSSEPPTTCPPKWHNLFLSLSPHSCYCVCDWALPARDNSISVQQIQTLIEFSHLNPGRNSSASLQSWELFLKRIFKTARKSNITFLKHFKVCVCTRGCISLCKQRNNCSLCMRGARLP